MKNNNGCKIIMYHYIRDNDSFMPNLKYLHVKDFIKQLDYFKRKHGFVQKGDWINFINKKIGPPKGVVLCFDDGLIDHYKYVLPILKQRKLWGIFFIPTRQLRNNNILNVHKIHYLLGRYDSQKVYEKFVEVLSELDLQGEIGNMEIIQEYKNQEIDKYSLIIKKINYYFDYSTQTRILDKLMKNFYEPIENIWNNLYLNEKQINKIIKEGNIVGGHSDRHFLLSKLDKKDLYNEIIDSGKKLNNITKFGINYFCYPYGLDNSYNKETIEILNESGIEYSFCIKSRDLIYNDIINNKHELPRYDCTSFKYGGINKN